MTQPNIPNWTPEILAAYRQSRGLTELAPDDAKQVLDILASADETIADISVEAGTQPAVTFAPAAEREIV